GRGGDTAAHLNVGRADDAEETLLETQNGNHPVASGLLAVRPQTGHIRTRRNPETTMSHDHPKSTASIAGHPIHPMLIPFPIAFLVGALLTDIAYLKSGWAMWAYASSWLIGAGIGFALLAAIFGFIDYFGEERIRRLKVANAHMIANLPAVAVSAVNFI